MVKVHHFLGAHPDMKNRVLVVKKNSQMPKL
jgi:hypothetical protein